MSQRYGRKIAGRRAKKGETEYDFTYSGFSKESDEPYGIREGGDGQASPVNEWPGISDDGELSLTVHSVPVGGRDKTKFGNELGGITDRISKLLNEYESVYNDESHIGESVTGQIYLDNLLSDYHNLCQEREEVLESLHDSLDMDEDEILDRLEKMTKRSKDDIEDSDRVVNETIEQAKLKFERLRELNKEIILLSKQGQDVGKLEQEKNDLQEELLMYKRMAVQQKVGSISKSRRKSLLKKDESLQWKLVAGEMLDIVKNIKLEGKTDKVQLEKDLNMILLAMGGLNEQIEKMKVELTASESNIKKLQEEKTSLQQQYTMKEQEVKDKVLEIKNCRKLIKKLGEEKAQAADKALAREQEDKAKQVKEAELKRPDTFDDIMQAQLRDQRNKALKLEEQNKELLAQIESYQEENQARKETESNLAQMLSIPGMEDCSTCQLLGRQVLTSREEITQLSSKIEELENELAELRCQLMQAQEDLENAMKSHVDVSKRTELIEGQEATSSTPSPIQEVSSESAESGSPEPKKPRKREKVGRKAKGLKKPEAKKKTKEGKTKMTEAKTSDEESKSEEEIRETEEGKAIEETAKEDMDAEETGKEEMGEREVRKEARKRGETVKGEKDHRLTGVGSRQKADMNVPYVEVREAKTLSLCDTGTQIRYTDHSSAISKVADSRPVSLAKWKASKDRKHSLADAMKSNAPPNVIQEETSMVASVIKEEANRLCEDICTFMEFGYDLIEKEEKILSKQLDEEGVDVSALKEYEQGHEHDTRTTSTTRGRRQSVFSDVFAAGDLPPAPFSDAFPSRDRRASIYSDALPPRERRASIYSDTLPSRDRTSRDRRQSIQSDAFPTRDRQQSIYADVLPAKDRRQSYLGDVSPFPDRLQNGEVTPVGDRTKRRSSILQLDLHRGGPMHPQPVTLSGVEDGTVITHRKPHEYLKRGEGAGTSRMKKELTSMAQTAINIIKDTGDVFQYRLNEKLGHYEKFYEMWRETRKSRREKVTEDSIRGKGVVQVEKDRSDVKYREEHKMEYEETDVLLPLSTKESAGKSLDQTFIMIAGSSTKSERQTPSPHLPPPIRKRGKPKAMTRQQQLMKQKALLERARHQVETKTGPTRIPTVETAGHRSPRPQQHRGPKEGQHKPRASSINQAFNLPFIAHGIGKHEEPTEKNTVIQKQLSTVENVQKSFSSWNKQAIQKYYSANDVPAFKSELRTSQFRRKTKNKLPNLNISNLFGTF